MCVCSRGLPSWTGNGQLASSRSSTPPERLGRATDAAGPAHHGLGSSPIGVPIGDTIRRIRRCTPCVCVCVWTFMLSLQTDFDIMFRALRNERYSRLAISQG